MINENKIQDFMDRNKVIILAIFAIVSIYCIYIIISSFYNLFKIHYDKNTYTCTIEEIYGWEVMECELPEKYHEYFWKETITFWFITWE